MVYLLKIFPSEHKVFGEEAIAYIFHDDASDGQHPTDKSGGL